MYVFCGYGLVIIAQAFPTCIRIGSGSLDLPHCMRRASPSGLSTISGMNATMSTPQSTVICGFY